MLVISVLSLRFTLSCLFHKHVSGTFKYFSLLLGMSVLVGRGFREILERKKFFSPSSLYSFVRLLQCASCLQGLVPATHTAALVPSSWGTGSFSSTLWLAAPSSTHHTTAPSHFSAFHSFNGWALSNQVWIPVQGCRGLFLEHSTSALQMIMLFIFAYSYIILNSLHFLLATPSSFQSSIIVNNSLY